MNRKPYTKEEIFDIVKSCKNKKELQDRHGTAYTWILRNNCLDEVNEILPSYERKHPDLNKEYIFKVAKECNSIDEFIAKYPKYHKYSLRKGFFGKIKKECFNLAISPNHTFSPKIGDKFKEFTIINLKTKTIYGRKCWLVKCSCGQNKRLNQTQLKNPNSFKNCGHSSKRFSFKEGDKLGWWTVLDPKVDTERKIKAQCKCGTIRNVRIYTIGTKETFSCGCYNREILNQNNHLEPGESAFNDLFYRYKAGAKKRNHDFKLSKEEFKDFTKMKCYYCNTRPGQIENKLHKSGNQSVYTYNGIDRVDNSKGYLKNNCVPCCRKCNLKKNSTSVQMCKKIFTFIKNSLILASDSFQVQKDFLVPIRSIYYEYKRRAKFLNKDFSLTFNELASLINKKCFYCGKIPSNIRNHGNKVFPYNGLDRINNDKGYTKRNCVPCCHGCNTKKSNISLNIVQKILNFISA